MVVDVSRPPDKWKPVDYLASPFAENHARFSPDSRWIAYTSNASGQNEVWVESFPRGNGKWMVSKDGGNKPRWRSDGRELYYYSTDEKLMAVPIRPGAVIDFGAPQFLFEAKLQSAVGWPYDVTPDGQKFILLTVETREHNPIILNWPALLRHR